MREHPTMLEMEPLHVQGEGSVFYARLCRRAEK